MAHKKATPKKRRTVKKKAARKTTVRRRATRDRHSDTLGRGLIAVAAVLGGIAIGWILMSWYQGLEQPAGSAPPGLNVTARGDMLVEIPTREQVVAMSAEERERIEGQVVAALADVSDPANEPRPGNSMTIMRGRFESADDARQASGTVEVLKATGIRIIVRFDDFHVTNGPSLHVYLVEDPEIPMRNSANLGNLKGNTGSQNYEISTHYDLKPEHVRYVIVYDKLFDRTYAVARLEPTENWDDRFWRNRG